MPKNEKTRLLPGENEIAVRLYGQGLGDCFLLAFPRPGAPENPCYMVIDCGISMSTPNRVPRTQRIVDDIATATGRHVDVLAITHQHFDHVSSFQDAWREWKGIAVEDLHLPWVESTAEKGEHKTRTDFRQVLDQAARKALERGLDSDLKRRPAFQAQADFFGVTLEKVGENQRTLVGPKNMDDAMDFARQLCRGQIRYFSPGDVFRLPGTNCHGYVLGPPLPELVEPRTEKRYIELLADEHLGVMYSYADFGMKVDAGQIGDDTSLGISDDSALPALASGLLAGEDPLRESDEDFSPFAAQVRLDWDYAMASPFFSRHYLGAASAQKNPNGEEKSAFTANLAAWRCVDNDWLAGSAELALRAGDYTNNLSLVLAFDVPGSDKMLLFPGDAQVGNWLSWHEIRKWNLREGAMPERPPQSSESETLMENLLGRVAFYKVGHHGSHNATVKERGLELMKREDLVAFVPVSVPVAQDLMGYCPMPFYPVLRALQVRTHGRVFLPSGNALEPLPLGKDQETMRRDSGLRPAEEKLATKSNTYGLLEAEVPLYLELRVGK